MAEKRNYMSTVPCNVITVDKIYTIHYFEYIKNFSGIGEDHNFWEMVYVDCGSIEVTAGQQQFSLNQGELCFHAPNEYHNIVSANKFSSVFIMSFCMQSLDVAFFHNRRVLLNEWSKELIAQILAKSAQVFSGALDIMDQTQLVRSSGAPYGGEQIIKMLTEQLLIEIVGGYRAAQKPAKTPPTAPKHRRKEGNEQYIVDTVIQVLANHLYEKLTLDEICQKVNFSKSYVEKIFRNNMGHGIIHYFNKLKTNEAKRLISEGQNSFTEISEKLQFGSIHYFSRTFRAMVGMSPSEYASSVKRRGLL